MYLKVGEQLTLETLLYGLLLCSGNDAAVAIAEHILTTGDASGYLKFLTTGGSDYPIEELKLAGVDLSKPDTVEAALDVFAKSVAELEALLQGLE